MGEFSAKTFSSTFMPHTRGFVHNDLKKGVSFHYIVPDTLCRSHLVNGRTGRPQFSAAAIMAIFDEVSTYSCAMKDRKLRPGLSVHLSTEVIEDIHAGDEITILTCADKIGNTLGYASLEVLNKQGELVARGKHIKHLPMGKWFEFITHPMIAPISLKLHELALLRENRKKQKEGNHDLMKMTGSSTIEGIGRVFDLLGLKSLTKKFSFMESTTADNAMFCSENGRIDPNDVHSYTMTVKQITSNLRNTMHGGAVGCAVEHACLLSRSGNTQEDGSQEGRDGVYELPCYVKQLEVRYISPMKGDLVITTANDPHSPLLFPPTEGSIAANEKQQQNHYENQREKEQMHKWCTKSIGKVLNQKDGSLCAEYVCTWARCTN